MKAINTYGIKINLESLIAAAKETENYPKGSPAYDEVFYDRETGEVWTKYQYSLGMNNWTEYDDPAVIKIANATRHYSAQKIMDLIAYQMGNMID